MHAVVTEVEVRKIPFTDSEGQHWDLFSGPDLYCEVYGPDGQCLYSSDTVSDVRPTDLPVPLEDEFAIEAEGPHILRLLDEDIFDSEVLARVAFEPGRLAGAGQGPEPPHCVQFQDGETILQLSLSWSQHP